MRRKILLYFAALFMTTGSALAQQSGKLQGKVTDATSNEEIPSAIVVVKQKGAQKGGTAADYNGVYIISPLTPGTYDVEISSLGFVKKTITGVTINVDQTRFLNVKLDPTGGTVLEAVEVVYVQPVIDPDNTTTSTTFTKEQIQKMPTRETNSIAQQSASVTATDDRSGLNVKGNREAGTQYYINGVKVIGSTAPQLPTTAIEQIAVLTGGVPAQYGDALGGIINITTQGPSSQFFGGIELETSAPLDKYDTNLGALSLSGPIITQRDTAGNKGKTLLGFFVSGQYIGSQDIAPSAAEVWHLKDETRRLLETDPFFIDENGALQERAQLLTKDDMELKKNGRRINMAESNYTLNGSLDFQPSTNTTVTVGGSFERRDRRNHTTQAARQNHYLLNPQFNPRILNQNYNFFARFTQRFAGLGQDSVGLQIKSAYYQIQADYTKQKRTIESPQLKDNLFGYGYVGQFGYERGQVLDSMEIDGVMVPQLVTYSTGQNRGLTFNGSEGYNSVLSGYNSSLFGLQGQITTLDQNSTIDNPSELLALGGVFNGTNPRAVGGARYGIFNNYGTRPGLYQLNDDDQYRLSALGSVQLNNHSLKVGFEFEQRVQTFYQVNPSAALWQLGRGLMNRHLTTIDASSGVLVGTEDGLPVYDFTYNTNPDNQGQSTFDRNLRAALGIDSNVRIDIDQFSRAEVERMNISMFSAEELLNAELVNYQGYTHDGKRSTKKVEFADYFREGNEGTRPMDAFRPIYAAGFIEDKFAIDDLILRLGVRVDRYDANQMVLKDKYALVDLETAGELGDAYQQFANYGQANVTTTPGRDWVVYVDGDPLTTPIQNLNITGFRSGDTFYDVSGGVVDNPLEVRASGGYFPYFTRDSNPSFIEGRRVSLEAFEDYTPQVIVAPRLSFSFPISEDALFFAHYDILAQRPERISTNPADFYYLSGQVNNLINNGALRPQRKIDYQVGFQQRLSQTSGLTLSAFYSDMRDLIQVRQINAAYPQTPYLTFDNIDYGTVKGLTVEYDLRRTANLTLGASYTLQFAQGTGSGATTGFNLAAAGGQLRTLTPLDYDQRHAMKLNMDYRFRDGEGLIAGSPILQNAGISFNLYAGSGTPYSRAQNPVTAGDFTVNETVFLAGRPNGSRLPGNVRAGMRIDKDFKFRFGKDDTNDQGEVVNKKEPKIFNVYLRVQNLFNARNVLRVYRYTGSPTDDAFLTERFLPAAGSLDPHELSIIDLYTIKLQDPQNFTLPRRALLGVTFSF